MANDAASMEKAARLALSTSRDDWAMVSLHLPDGAAPQRFCTADCAAVCAVLEALEAQVNDEACDLPDLRTSVLPAGCLDLAERAGLRSYRAVRRRFAYGTGNAVCVLAVAGTQARGPAAGGELGLIADLLVAAVSNRAAGGAGDDAMFGFQPATGDSAPRNDAG